MEKLVQQILAYLNTIPRPKNWVLKLISFFFALFLWYFVAGEDKVDMNVFIPVEIVNLPRDMVISNQFKKQLEVTVSGQPSLIRGLSNQHITRSVDLSHAEPGKVVINNTPDSIPFPWGVSVLRLQPSQITLLIDRLIEKELPIRPRATGSPPEGYDYSIVLEPAAITISGPKTVLDEEQYLTTNLFDIAGLKTTTLKQVSLNLTPVLTDLIGETVVTAHINIKEEMSTREITNIPLELVHGGNQKYQIPQATVTVEAELPVPLIIETKNLRSLFRAIIEPKGPTSRKNEFAVTINLTEEAKKFKDAIRIVSYSPKTVPVEIIKEKRPVIEGKRIKIPIKGKD